MNTLLIFPFSIVAWNDKFEEPRLPLNITYLGAAARKAGHQVSLMDLRMEQQIRNFDMPKSMEDATVKTLTDLMDAEIAKSEIKVVGINCLYSGLFPPLRHLATHIKKQNPDIKVVIGGIHPTIYTKEILDKHSDIIDFVINGEGEKSFVDLLAYLEGKGVAELSAIGGLGYRQDGESIVTPRGAFIEDLDGMDFPAVDLLNVENYYTDTSGWYSPKGQNIKTPVPILSSRSCPIECNFCSMHFVHGDRARYRSPEDVVEEMKMYIDTYGLRYFNITDDNLTINRKRLVKLMDLIVKENLDIQFSTENGVYINGLNEEVMDAMSSAGLARLHLAFESGSDYIRNEVIGKKTYNKKIDEIKDLVKLEKYNHIYLYGYFILGFPEETLETLADTAKLITTFPLDNYSLFYAIPFPGTRLFDQCVKDKLFMEDYFYDQDALLNQVNVGQMVTGLPSIRPYNLAIEDLMAFKEKYMKFIDDKRKNSGRPGSSPLSREMEQIVI
ncbi:MAG: radical SAM protein [Magnetococcales bacterium]|nr:radical SAM protein [Magnetococcales bacterium]